MAVRKIAKDLVLLTYKRQCCGYQINLNQAYYMSTRNFRSSLMKGIEIVSQEDLKLKRRDDGPPLIEARVNRPLVLLFTWLGCTPNQSDKFIDLYLNKGFDVILVSFVVSEAFRWIQFSEKKTSFLLDFLHRNEAYNPIVFHGFSIGTGLWTSMLGKMAHNEEEHGPLANRIKGQIWDSVTQTSNLIRSVCYSAFPTNRTMGQLLYKFTRVILHVAGTDIENVMNSTYEKNNFIFNNPPFKKPSLLFCSKGDIYSDLDGVLSAFENWKSIGMQAYVKYWDNSTHVGHFYLHREEYLEALNSFLRSIGVEKQELGEVIAPYAIPQIQKIQISIMKQ